MNEAVFSPKNNLIASASGDKTVIIGEIPEVTLWFFLMIYNKKKKT